MSYTPKPGTKIHAAIEFLTANGPTSTANLAAALDIPSSDVRSNMLTAVKHGLLFTERNGPISYWNLGAGPDADSTAAGAAPDVPDEPNDSDEFVEEEDEFLVSMHSDGELTLSGMQQVENGVVLTNQQALKLAVFLIQTVGFLEHCERVMSEAVAS